MKPSVPSPEQTHQFRQLQDVQRMLNVELLFVDAWSKCQWEQAQWLHSVKPTLSLGEEEKSAVFSWACSRGHLEMAQWYLRATPDLRVSFTAAELACARGHLSVVQWLEATQPSLNFDSAFSGVLFAAQQGHWAVVRWFWKEHPMATWPLWCLGAAFLAECLVLPPSTVATIVALEFFLVQWLGL